MPLRAWLLSEDEQFIIQLQNDRFIMNWRATGVTYPRFSERHGPRGLLSQMEAEFERFCDFVQRRADSRPSPSQIELGKIDLLLEGRHWGRNKPLSALVPITDAFAEIHDAADRE